MTDIYEDIASTSTGGLSSPIRRAPTRLFIYLNADEPGWFATREISHAAYEDISINRHVGRTYPAWLNLVSWLVLAVIPLGLFIIYLGISTVGLGFMFVGFLGIWVFGNIAARKGRDVTRVTNLAPGR